MGTNVYSVEYTDTFGGAANYSWVRRERVTMPELTEYGYDGATNYVAANRRFERALKRRAKKAVGLAGVSGRWSEAGGMLEFRPYRMCTVLFVAYVDE